MSKQIQNYYIEKVIREEIIGIVYLAVHLPSNKQVTIHLLTPSLLNKSFYRDLSKNYNVLVSLNHPCIGKFYTCIKQADQLYLISEYIRGVTLSGYIVAHNQLFPEEKIWDLFVQIIDAFSYAHTKGVNHFTINPDKIIITADDQVKVIDFGIASLFTNQLRKALPEGIDLNKVQYRTPEQIQGKAQDTRSDIYALGVILFELLTKQCAYPSALSESDIKHKIIHHNLPPIKIYTKAFAYSYTMQAIIDKATAKNPAYRFQDFQELKQSFLEEKDERETMILNQLMQEVDARIKLTSGEQITRNKVTNQKTSKKRIGQAFLLLALMVGAISIGLNIHTSSSNEGNEGLIGLNKDAQRGNTTDTNVSDEENDTTEPGGTTLVTPSPLAEDKVSGEKRPVPDAKITHSSVAAPNQEKAKSSNPRAGFSLETNPEKRFSQVELQNKLEDFYAALRSKDLTQASGYYAPVLSRFFNENNINEKQLQRLLQKAWKRTPEDKHEILWNTFRYTQDRQGNYTMEFYMNYVYHRANRKAWRARKIYTMIKMDKDLKIYYMSGD